MHKKNSSHNLVNNALDSISSSVETVSEEQTIGQVLREKRINSKKELGEIGTYLRIKSLDIEAIENDAYDKITKHLYVPGLIRSYGSFLKIEPQIIENKIRALKIKSNTDNKDHQLLNIGEPSNLSPTTDVVLNFSLITVVLFLVLLSVYNFRGNKENLVTTQDLVNEIQLHSESQ